MPIALKKRLSAQILPFSGLLLLAPLGACDPAPALVPATPTAAHQDSGCGENGSMQTALFGSLQTSVSWTGSEMLCENMLRPNNEGVRLRFVGDVEGEKLALIIAIPGLKEGEVGAELPSNVTTTVEGSGRFFSTANLDSCWTDIHSQSPIAGAMNIAEISGTLFCVAPLGEINSDNAVSIPELTFTTLVRWTRS